MNKRHLYHTLKLLKRISYWYLLLLFMVFGAVSVVSLRNNNLTAISLRDKVLETDRQNGDTEAALRELRGFVYGHMNTNLAVENGVYPPIQLKHRYDRLVAAEQERVKQLNSTDINAEAQEYCERTQPASFFGAGRLECISSYIDSNPKTETKPNIIPDSLYKFDFASPFWSADLAGISLLLAGLFGFLFVLRFGLERWMISRLRSHL
jgi:hypothetical protein